MPHEKGETKTKIDHIFIKFLDDGTFLYKSGNMDKGNMNEYSASSPNELIKFVEDDVKSPHMKNKEDVQIEPPKSKTKKQKIALVKVKGGLFN